MLSAMEGGGMVPSNFTDLSLMLVILGVVEMRRTEMGPNLT